jgi:hypothetical protein
MIQEDNAAWHGVNVFFEADNHGKVEQRTVLHRIEVRTDVEGSKPLAAMFYTQMVKCQGAVINPKRKVSVPQHNSELKGRIGPTYRFW